MHDVDAMQMCKVMLEIVSLVHRTDCAIISIQLAYPLLVFHRENRVF